MSCGEIRLLFLPTDSDVYKTKGIRLHARSRIHGSALQYSVLRYWFFRHVYVTNTFKLMRH